MKSKTIVVFLVVVCVSLVAAVVLFIPFRRDAFFRAHQSECMRNLCDMSYVLYTYGMDNNYAFPSNFTTLCGAALEMNHYISHPKIFLCKGSQSHVGSLTDVDEWSDYIYIPWATGITNTPADYPVMYDRRLSNHQGKGINELHIDGSVTFDEGANELKKFAAKHPDLHIPMPEDLK